MTDGAQFSEKDVVRFSASNKLRDLMFRDRWKVRKRSVVSQEKRTCRVDVVTYIHRRWEEELFTNPLLCQLWSIWRYHCVDCYLGGGGGDNGRSVG